MRTIIFILILASFLQATIIPIHLVLMILICRSIIDQSRENLFLAFGFGLLNAHLTLGNIGFQSLIYVVLVQIAQIFSRWRFSTHWLLIYPLTVVLLLIYTLQFSPQIFIESIFSIPIFFLVKLWEERFITKKDIKLKL